jgi:hypothetical protein
MPEYTIDLHNHTPFVPKDYRGDLDTTPRQMVERALELGIDVLGVTDHFSIDFAPAAVAAADEVAAETGRRLLVVPGAELRLRSGEDEAHLLCLFPPALAVVRFRSLLGAIGLADPVASRANLPFYRIDRDVCQVARLVEALGGISLLGHADRVFAGYRLIDTALAQELAECDALYAIELAEPESRRRFRDDLPLAFVASSDSHSLEEMGTRTTRLEMADLSFEALREALKAECASSEAR